MRRLLICLLLSGHISIALAAVYSHSDSQLIAGYSQATNIRFQATAAKENQIELATINITINDKKIIATVVLKPKIALIQLEGKNSKTNKITMLTEEEQNAMNQLLNEVLQEKEAANPLRQVLINTLNLLGSWPTTLPLEMIK